ncbi:DUF3558 domain-containing protein [Pseudonocardia sp. RS11V-5]|uniref:DUF3558 domain-containing protein n=1 Tax=Pseudonocardia terrae TaxID=2905831 RepID=UPI001E3575EF|nr:DUF3558 domain-containing protein [Pseudonocardia terrae]MCE3556130.1 DUF3558 domain-containing protein [Pseudonocardia terrae]
MLLASCTTQPSSPVPNGSVSAFEVAAPLVSSPLDARGVDACAVLQPDRLSALGASDETARDLASDNAESCSWTSLDGSFMLDLAISVEAGLRFPYSIKDSFLAFQETEVDGYPAVNVDPPDAPTCSFWVGIAETQSFSADASSLSTSAPPLCEKARALASEVLDALRK